MLNRNFSWQEIAALLAFCGMILTGIKAFWFNDWRLTTVEVEVTSLGNMVEKNKEQLSMIQQDIRVIKLLLEQRNGNQSDPSSNHNH